MKKTRAPQKNQRSQGDNVTPNSSQSLPRLNEELTAEIKESLETIKTITKKFVDWRADDGCAEVVSNKFGLRIIRAFNYLEQYTSSLYEKSPEIPQSQSTNFLVKDLLANMATLFKERMVQEDGRISIFMDDPEIKITGVNKKLGEILKDMLSITCMLIQFSDRKTIELRAGQRSQCLVFEVRILGLSLIKDVQFESKSRAELITLVESCSQVAESIGGKMYIPADQSEFCLSVRIAHQNLTDLRKTA